MSWTNAPEFCCVPPEMRLTESVDAMVTGGMIAAGTAGTYASSTLSPSTKRQSAPALKTFAPPTVFVHTAVLPMPLVGTFWSVASRTRLRVVAALVTARKLKCVREMSPYIRTCRSLASGIRRRTPPFTVVHRVSLSSPILALFRSSLK